MNYELYDLIEKTDLHEDNIEFSMGGTCFILEEFPSCCGAVILHNMIFYSKEDFNNMTRTMLQTLEDNKDSRIGNGSYIAIDNGYYANFFRNSPWEEMCDFVNPTSSKTLTYWILK